MLGPAESNCLWVAILLVGSTRFVLDPSQLVLQGLTWTLEA